MLQCFGADLSWNPMLSRLNKSIRIRAAVALAVAYSFCVLAPAVALAFTDGDHAAHCLTDHHGMAADQHGGTAHMHADGQAHHHPDGASNADGKAHPGNCCGLFCMTALAHDPQVPLLVLSHASAVPFPADMGLPSRGPDRINRPHIA
jgi:hypothetical protein